MMTARKPESVYAQLAMSAVQKWVNEKVRLIVTQPVPAELSQPAACFVSLKKQGLLRGCIGTIVPTEVSLAEEIISNSVGAAERDPRFEPVQQDELEHLTCSVDVLSAPCPIDNLRGHDPRRFGLIVEWAGRRGLLLPNLDGVDTPDQQLEVCLAKAGLELSDPVHLFSFTSTRYY